MSNYYTLRFWKLPANSFTKRGLAANITREGVRKEAESGQLEQAAQLVFDNLTKGKLLYFTVSIHCFCTIRN